ncbi:ABC transporter permease [Iocasia frigidifontis]|nr:ABC transporter permease subunit [Iocasia fonsfrigidae]
MNSNLSLNTANLLDKDSFWKKIWKQRALVFMSLPFIIYVIIFKYIPIWGWIIAFQNYWPAKGILEQTWVGLENFRMLFEDPIFYQILRNTLAMSIIKLVFGMFFSILLALMLNEVRNLLFKKFTQTISYLPHFISWVVGANLVMNILSTDGGIINEILLNLHIIDKPIMFMGIPKLFWWVVGASHVWKTVGFGAILYLASMTSISPSLYEAATIDGASRLQRIWYITLPGIKPVIIILFIMNIGQLMNVGFEQIYLLSNGRVIEYSRIFTIFELDYGLKMMRYSFATAVGIFRSVVSLVLVFGANHVAKQMGEERLI